MTPELMTSLRKMKSVRWPFPDPLRGTTTTAVECGKNLSSVGAGFLSPDAETVIEERFVSGHGLSRAAECDK